MAYVEIVDMVPPVRMAPDDAAWNRYRLESSVDGSTWSTFEGPRALSPAVVDHTHPPTYNFVSLDAPDGAIYFRVVWIDTGNVEQPTLPLLRPEPLPPWTPSLSDVASHIPLRTKIANGVTVGTFTNATKPATSDVVQALIPKGVRRVMPFFSEPITDPIEARKAKDLAALWTAMLIELGLFSDQVNNDQSPYQQLKELWDDETGGGDSGGGGDADDLIGRAAPSWQFETRPPLRW